MTQRALAHLARLLWPHIRPYVQDAMMAKESQIAELIQQRIAEQAEDRAARATAPRYIGER
jgi:hypothetical protein